MKMSLFNLRIQLLNKKFTFGVLINEPLQIRNYAARKGYRMARAKNKVKVVQEKKVFIPHNLRDQEKMLATRAKRKFDDSWKQKDPLDDVYILNFYRQKVYSFAEAVECHRETHHPEILNRPNEYLHVNIELNMQGEKQTRFVDNFYRVAPMPHKFKHGEERRIAAFAKDATALQEAISAGAELTGGLDLIKQVQNGQITIQDFDFILAHPDILPELVQLRGLMKRKFPNPKHNTLGVDLGDLVSRFFNGVSYEAKKDEFEKDFGLIETIVGTLDMQTEHLEENFASLINDVWQMKPRRQGPFIARVLLASPPSKEKLRVDHEIYLKTNAENDDKDVEDEVEEAVQKNVAL